MLSSLVPIRFYALLYVVAYVKGAEVQPPSGDCWSSTFEVIQQEIGAAINPAVDRSEERKYVFCSDTIYRIKSLNPQTAAIPNATLGEQWLILPFNPNVHLYCQQNCVLEMIDEGNAVFGATTALIAGSGLIPAGFTAAPSRLDNLIVDGFTIRNTNGVLYDDAAGVLTLGPPGNNILIQNCAFETVGLSGWAIASEYYDAEAQLDPNMTLYQSVTVQDCTFSVRLKQT